MTNEKFWEMKENHQRELEEDLEKLYFELEDNYNAYLCGDYDFGYSDAFVEVEIHRADGRIIPWYFQVMDRALLKDIVKYILTETRFSEVTVFTADHDTIPTFRSIEDVERDFNRYC